LLLTKLDLNFFLFKNPCIFMNSQNPALNFEGIYTALAYYANVSPDNIAITAPGRPGINYKTLKQQVEALSVILNSIDYKKKPRIAIIMPNGPEMALAFLATSSFATAAPLNPQYQAADLRFYLSDLNADALLIHSESNSSAREVAKEMNLPIFEAIFDAQKPAGIFSLSSQTPLNTQGEIPAFAQAQDIALLLHTSGTTSRPKLVPLSHQNLCTSASNIVKTLSLSEADRCLNIMPLFHIHGLIAALLASLAAGGSIVCSPGLNTEQFFNWLKDLKPTWYSGVPTMHQAILSSAKKNTATVPANFLRFIRSSSSALAPQIMSALEDTFKVPVIEAYGMTEAAHQMSSNPLPPEIRKPGSVGLPAGPEIAILDQHGNILTNPHPGEISIRGRNVTSGYQANQQANETAFTRGWFRTGDLGFIDEKGYLFVTGRLKEIINRGGEKISPREIDEALLDHPDIKQAVAFAVKHPSLGEDLAAAVILQENSQTDTQTIRDFLFDNLPEFKVPSQILILDNIPKGPTGKIQRIGLAEKLAAHFEQAYAEPVTELEIMLVTLFSELLKLPRVGVNENFFMLGGDSLLGTQLISRINSTLATELTPVTVFHAPTISELSVEILKQQTEQMGSESMLDLLSEIEKLTDDEVKQQTRSSTIHRQTRRKA
jgi:acyl-CoA synthetase (AMP-forming)/AMP-acid ligase II